jgi:hypothetical protein
MLVIMRWRRRRRSEQSKKRADILAVFIYPLRDVPSPGEFECQARGVGGRATLGLASRILFIRRRKSDQMGDPAVTSIPSRPVKKMEGP